MALTLSPLTFLARATVSTSSSTTEGRPPVRPCAVLHAPLSRAISYPLTLNRADVPAGHEQGTQAPAGGLALGLSRYAETVGSPAT